MGTPGLILCANTPGKDDSLGSFPMCDKVREQFLNIPSCRKFQTDYIFGFALMDPPLQFRPYIIYLGLYLWTALFSTNHISYLWVCTYGPPSSVQTIYHIFGFETTHFQCSHWGKEVVAQNFLVHGPIHPSLDMVKSSHPLSRETPPKHKISTYMLHSGDGVLGVVLSIYLPPNTELMPNSSILVSSDHITFSQASSGSSRWSLANFRRACTCTFFSRGTLRAQQDFNPSRCHVLLMVLFVTVVPTAFRSLTSSSGVVLGWSLTFLVIIDIPRGEILRGAPDRGRLAVTLCFFHFLIIAPTVVNFSPSCLLIFL